MYIYIDTYIHTYLEDRYTVHTYIDNRYIYTHMHIYTNTHTYIYTFMHA